MAEQDNPQPPKDEDEQSPYKLKKRKDSDLSLLPYFVKVRNTLGKAKQAKQKANTEKQRVRNLLARKKAEAKKNPQANADVNFLKIALKELPMLEGEIQRGISQLTRILETKTKEPYKVLIGFEMRPLPSQNKKNKNKDKNKNKNGKKGQDAKQGQNNTNKLSKSRLDELRGLKSPNKNIKKAPAQKQQINNLLLNNLNNRSINR